jgi:chromate reductase
VSVLVITGSARRDSYTRRLGEALVAGLPGGALAPRLTDLPYFDQDLEAAPPASVEALRAQVRAADAVVVVTPEYNGTVSGLLGNAVDWLSRPYGAGSLRGKPAVAVAASPGEVGGARAVVSLRTLLGNTGAQVLGRPITVGGIARLLDAGALDEVVEQVAEALDDAVARAARAA